MKYQSVQPEYQIVLQKYHREDRKVIYDRTRFLKQECGFQNVQCKVSICQRQESLQDLKKPTCESCGSLVAVAGTNKDDLHFQRVKASKKMSAPKNKVFYPKNKSFEPKNKKFGANVNENITKSVGGLLNSDYALPKLV